MKEYSCIFLIMLGLFLGMTSSCPAGEKMTVIYSATVKQVLDGGKKLVLDRGEIYGLRLGMKGFIGDPYERLEPIVKVRLEKVQKKFSVVKVTGTPKKPIKKMDMAIFIIEEDKPQGEIQGEIRLVLRRLISMVPKRMEPKIIGSIVLKDSKTYIDIADPIARQNYIGMFSHSGWMPEYLGGEEIGMPIVCIPNTPFMFWVAEPGGSSIRFTDGSVRDIVKEFETPEEKIREMLLKHEQSPYRRHIP